MHTQYTTLNPLTTHQMIDIMLAHTTGAYIKTKVRTKSNWFWVFDPIWNWGHYNYAICNPNDTSYPSRKQVTEAINNIGIKHDI